MNRETKIIINLIIFTIIIGGGIFLFSSDVLKVDCELNPPTIIHCEAYNIERLKGCVREGYTGNGFLGMTDWNTEYWVCEDHGRVAKYCAEWSRSSPSNLTKDWKNCK
ncbi:hypothetical protein LCGC14_0970120 [marine sediment metagenome]|uniref:Uncharacterized protein n=1 Tax=marine sediment metagenome TaxID=412755 RepID=A0A0F9NGC9_9ZZZZ